MGRKSDQNAFLTTQRSTSPSAPPPAHTGPGPPPLPPRASTLTTPLDAPPPYAEIDPTYHSQPLTHSWSSQDPRASSTQSLVPNPSSEDDEKRTLLLIWIHGFMGNETSFQSFPAHVHNAVVARVERGGEADSGRYVVHTKIYPRYKSRNKIDVARDGFSDWLCPHEDPNTDIILLGHSMGGLLSAEVALMEPYSAGSIRRFRHRILGTINFDTPFLGMHPGVIASGLGSLFRPGPESPAVGTSSSLSGGQELQMMPTNSTTNPSTESSYFGDSAANSTTLMPTESTSSTTTLPLSSPYDIPTRDPNYNPPFTNDVRMPQRTGWSNAWHFINKHSDGLAKATKSYVTSHLEFGGCLADYSGLRNRYAKLRALEDVDPTLDTSVRFVNYYTASTGRPKKVKTATPSVFRPPIGQFDSEEVQIEDRVQRMDLAAPAGRRESPSSRTPLEQTKEENTCAEHKAEHDNNLLDADRLESDDEGAVSDVSLAMNHMDPAPVTDDEQENPLAESTDAAPFPPIGSAASNTSDHVGSVYEGPSIPNLPQPPQKAPSLPPVPSAPLEPSPFDPTFYTDKETRKLAEKEHSRTVKAFQRAVKDRDKAINDHRKFLEKREKNASKEREKLIKLEEKERVKAELDFAKKESKEASSKPTTIEESCPPTSKTTTRNATDGATAVDELENKPKRDKRFCLLPPTINNQADPCWIRIFMPGVDEVGAHCGLFLVDGERYERFVGDVAERIRTWVDERAGISNGSSRG